MSADNTQKIFSSTSGLLPTAILGKGGPVPSLSGVIFFVSHNSGVTICHGVPHRPSQFVPSHASVVSSNFCLVHLHCCRCTKLLPFDGGRPTKNSCSRNHAVNTFQCRVSDWNCATANMRTLVLPRSFFHLQGIFFTHRDFNCLTQRSVTAGQGEANPACNTRCQQTRQLELKGP